MRHDERGAFRGGLGDRPRPGLPRRRRQPARRELRRRLGHLRRKGGALPVDRPRRATTPPPATRSWSRPGVYGDLDLDGVLGEPGEEGADAATCDCLILARRDGLDPLGGRRCEPPSCRSSDTVTFAFKVAAPGAVLGSRNRGFSFVGDDLARVDGARARFAGNVLVGDARRDAPRRGLGRERRPRRRQRARPRRAARASGSAAAASAASTSDVRGRPAHSSRPSLATRRGSCASATSMSRARAVTATGASARASARTAPAPCRFGNGERHPQGWRPSTATPGATGR